MDLNNYNNVYFIGIGGIGMSALARYFHLEGYNVSGYDRTSTVLTSELLKEGIKIHFEDDVNKIEDVFKHNDNTFVIYTPAIKKSENNELSFFIDNNFIIKKRSEVLGLITKKNKGICIAGTHGKTTTSTLCAHILKQSHVDCNAFLGGVSQNYKSNLLKSDFSEYTVLEADEYDRSFLQLSPFIALVSSVDADHLDIYGSADKIQKSFNDFVSLVQKEGLVLLNKNIENNISVPDNIKKYTYSLNDKNSDFFASDIKLINGRYVFNLIYKDNVIIDLKLNIPGLLNVENAVGAAAVALQCGVSHNEIREALSSFKGIRRRFDIRINTKDFVLIDDYAHHPTEISATINSVRDMFNGKKITVVFQPHLYSRTFDFYKDFAKSLSLADKLLLMDIYAAREKPIKGVSSRLIFDLVDINDKYIVTKENMFDKLSSLNNEVVLMMGAGDIDKEIDKIVLLLDK